MDTGPNAIFGGDEEGDYEDGGSIQDDVLDRSSGPNHDEDHSKFSVLDAELDSMNGYKGGDEDVSQSDDVNRIIELCLGRKFAFEKRVEIVGSDIEPLRTSSAKTCCVACAHNARCQAFTYTAGDFRCLLKYSSSHRGSREALCPASALRLQTQGRAVKWKQTRDGRNQFGEIFPTLITCAASFTARSS